MIQFDEYCSDGLVQPPTSNSTYFLVMKRKSHEFKTAEGLDKLCAKCEFERTAQILLYMYFLCQKKIENTSKF